MSAQPRNRAIMPAATPAPVPAPIPDPIPAPIVAMVAFNGLFLSGNGLFMLIAPQTWYAFVPGVTDTGFFNQHFIRDIGIIQLFLGAAFLAGMVRPERRVGLWAGAASWLCAHAVFHLWEVAVGIC